MDHLADPTELLSLQGSVSATRGGKPCVNKSIAHFISGNSA